MRKKSKRFLTTMLTLTMVLSLFSGCGNKGKVDGEGEGKPTDQANKKPTIVVMGNHVAGGDDPNYKDPLTGEYTMIEERRNGALKAEDECREKLNVEIKYVEYPGNVTEVLLKSILSNDPLCNVADIPAYARGTILGQNILQKLDGYLDGFKDPEYSWMVPEPIYGNHYLVAEGIGQIPSAGLLYNISYLEKIEGLKENGEVVQPIDLWEKGEWTWSKFEQYLKKVKDYYSNKKAPIRQEKFIDAYQTDVLSAAMAAIKTTGATIFGDSGIGVDNKDTKRAVAYIDDLVSKNLITQFTAGYPRKEAFKNGETVFCDINAWEMPAVAEGLTKRGESMGVVPFPRPDDLPKDSEKYQQMNKYNGVKAVLKGISKEKTQLVVDTMRIYFNEKTKGLLVTDSIPKYLADNETAKNEAAKAGFDVLNEKYGAKLVEVCKAYNPKHQANEAYNLAPWSSQWEQLVRNSILGLNGSPKYDIAIDAQKQNFIDQTSSIQTLLKSEEVKDNIPPTISLVNGAIVLPKTQKPDAIKWEEYIKATDNVDGDLDIKNVVINTDKVEFGKVGNYDKALVATVKDKENNEKKAQFSVIIYDTDNKNAPVIEAKEGYRDIKKDEDTSKINWAKDFIDKAESAEGFDIKANITADITSLDTTKAGEYEVPITVKDYAGNEAQIKLKVKVVG